MNIMKRACPSVAIIDIGKIISKSLIFIYFDNHLCFYRLDSEGGMARYFEM